MSELALHNAVKSLKLELVQSLLEAGANANLQTDDSGLCKRTCLHYCASYEYNKNFAIAKLLLKHGADPNLQESHGFTPLHVAVTSEKPELVQILLQAQTYGAPKNADPSIQDKSGQTARDFAVARVKAKGSVFHQMAQAIPPSANDTKQLVDEDKLPTEEEIEKRLKEAAVQNEARIQAAAEARKNEKPEPNYNSGWENK